VTSELADNSAVNRFAGGRQHVKSGHYYRRPRLFKVGEGRERHRGAQVQIRQLHPLFVGEITGMDTAAPVTPDTIQAFEDAMARYAVCVIRNASLKDEDHIRFSRAFGPLELPPPGKKRIAPELFDIGNLDADLQIKPPSTSGPNPADFERFHTDSPFN
jgi:alpha-ketoglutarate-dependent 2,4-dichlorophenoxyacetate dioxygenase